MPDLCVIWFQILLHSYNMATESCLATVSPGTGPNPALSMESYKKTQKADEISFILAFKLFCYSKKTTKKTIWFKCPTCQYCPGLLSSIALCSSSLSWCNPVVYVMYFTWRRVFIWQLGLKHCSREKHLQLLRPRSPRRKSKPKAKTDTLEMKGWLLSLFTARPAS